MSEHVEEQLVDADLPYPGYGMRGVISGQLYLYRCSNPQCGRENWAPAIPTGQCCWCQYAPDDDREKS